tara:strand:- start:541 stop:729 length:189 start_codon:yes stop_codon:yes gene_type:complete
MNARKSFKRKLKKIKIGDAFHSVAQPIAKAIDKTIGTSISTCSACAKRQEALNNIFSSKLDT